MYADWYASDNTSPFQTVINAAPCDNTITSSLIDMKGGNSLVVWAKFTRVAATGTLILHLRWTPDDGVTIHDMMTDNSVPVSGAYTTSFSSVRRQSGSASFEVVWVCPNIVFPAGSNGKIRLDQKVAMVGAGPTDVVTVKVFPIHGGRTA